MAETGNFDGDMLSWQRFQLERSDLVSATPYPYGTETEWGRAKLYRMLRQLTALIAFRF
jgi:hypothetical protein